LYSGPTHLLGATLVWAVLDMVAGVKVAIRLLRGSFFRVMSVKLYAEFQSKQGRSYRE
jgi:hypothetical protein